MYFIELGFGHNIQAQYKIRCHCSQCEKVWWKPLETLRSQALEKTSVRFGGWNITVPVLRTLVLRYRNNTGIIQSESYLLHQSWIWITHVSDMTIRPVLPPKSSAFCQDISALVKTRHDLKGLIYQVTWFRCQNVRALCLYFILTKVYY